MKTLNIAVVSADKMNVVYRCIQNPISIAISNCKSFEATGNGLYKYAEGKYKLIPGVGTKAIISLEIVLNDGSIKNEEHIFRIRNIPRPTAEINGLGCQQCIIEMSKEELQNAVISINFNLSIYDINMDDKVESFQIEFPNKEKIDVFSNKLNNKSLDRIRKLSIGSVFIIDYIH